MKFFTKRKKSFALFFASVIVFETLTPLIAKAEGDGKPLSSKLEGMVDPFTGDFRYGIPLMHIPGPNGENIPIAANYLSNIQMEQEASWIGLGWDLNPGEISRVVKGVPDDIKGELVKREDSFYGKYYGPVYFKDFDYNNRQTATNPGSISNPAAGMDISNTNLNNGFEFEFPDYDKFYASSPEFASELKLRIFDYKTLYHWNYQQFINSTVNIYDDINYTDGGNNITRLNEFTKKPQFSFGSETVAKTRPNVDLFKNDTNYPYGPNSYYPWSNVFFTNCFTTTTPVASTRSHGSNFVEYFTNGEINNRPSGFLNYEPIVSSQSVRSTNFPSDGIGAFRITTPSGLTYHYSLPIYFNNQTNTHWKLNDDFTFNVPKTEADYFKYAESWKLTAITGPGYVDKNGNFFPDSGDEGYWVSFNYGLWSSNYSFRAPFYGFYLDKQTSLFSGYGSSDYDLSYLRQGSCSSNDEQIYYLNSIKTATHTAYFIKDIRKDQHSRKNSSGIVTPKLKLDRIVLLRNEDDQGYLNPNSTDVLPQGGFNLTGSGVTPANITHIGNYNAHKQAIDNASLKMVVFKTDHSLCKKLYNNINNTFSVTGSGVAEHDVTFVSSTGDGGKLTLKSIETYEKGAGTISPPYKFEYALNPDYAHDKTDIWGNYKNDFDYSDRGQYTTSTSKLELNAWSLSKITIPTGAEINITYEPDSYSKVGYSNYYPHKLFLVKTYNSNTGEITFNDKNALNFLTSNVKRLNFYVPLKTLAATGCNCVDQLYTLSDTLTYSDSNPGTGSGVYTLDLSANTVRLINPVVGGCHTGTCPNRSYTFDNLGYLDLYSTLSYGGGTRVKEISIKDNQSGDIYKNSYQYSDGVITGEPDRFESPIKYSSYLTNLGTLPSSVGYSKVKIYALSSNNNSEGYKELEFLNYKYHFSETSSREISAGEKEDRTELYDDFSLYGKLKSEKIFNINNQLLYSLENEYAESSTREEENPVFEDQKVVTEAFHTHIKATQSGYLPSFETSVYIKKDYKVPLLSQKIVNNGVSTLIEFANFDSYTGVPLRTVVTDQSSGVSETLLSPAYSTFPALGSKLVNINNKNILAPLTKSVINKGYSTSQSSLKLGRVDQVNTVGGSLSHWTNNLPYRKFDPTALKYVSQNETDDNCWTVDSVKTFNNNTDEKKWRLQSDVTLFDKKTKRILEQHSGIRYSATKLGYRQRFKLAEASDCNYNSFAFSSFEDTLVHTSSSGNKIYFGGEITGGSYRFSGDNVVAPHSGLFVAKVPPAQKGPTFYSEVNNTSSGINIKEKGLQCGRTYRASVWMHETSANTSVVVAKLTGTSTSQGTINQQNSTLITDTKNIKVNHWVLMKVDITVPADMLNGASLEVYTSSGTTGVSHYADDFSFEPIDAIVSKFVYDPATGWVKATLDKENFATFYNYDAGGRVTSLSKETAAGIKKVSETSYKISQ